MTELFLKILNMSITAGWFILAIVVLRFLFRKMPKSITVIMWAMVGIRLICPFSFESGLSLIPSAETVPIDIMYSADPLIQSGIPAVNNVVNGLMTESFAPNPLSSANPMQIWMALAGFVWIIGIAMMLLYAVISYVRVRKRTAEAICWKENIWLCDHVESPFILGLIYPRIYLPSNLETVDVAYVLAHEKAHLKRKDHWWKPLGFLLLTVYWFNPLCWIGYILLCRDIELACDEKVLGEMNMEEKKIYANALINCSFSKKMITACPLAFGEVGVKKRVKTILSYKKPAFWILLIGIIICGYLAVSFMTNPVTKFNDQLNVFIDCQLADYHNSGQEGNLARCLDWRVLGTKKRGNTQEIYMWVLYEEFSNKDGLQVETGSHIPTVLTVKKEGYQYELVELWVPRDGSYYAKDIRQKFPWHLEGKALDPLLYSDEQHAVCQKMAEEYFASMEPEEEDTPEIQELRNRFPRYFDLDTSKGLEVYVWQMSGSSYNCILVSKKNIEWSYMELSKYPSITIEEMRAVLSTYHIPREQIAVNCIYMPYSSFYYEIDHTYQKRIEKYLFEDVNVEYQDGDNWGIEMGITFQSATAFEVTFQHNSEYMKEEGELTTESIYGIVSSETGESMAIAEITWEDMAYIIEKDGTTTIKGDIYYGFGELLPGTYEFWKRVTLTNSEGEQQHRVYSAEFAVVE